MPARSAARLIALQAKYAGTDANLIPKDPRHLLTDDQTKLRWRMVHGLPPTDDMPANCCCNYDLRHDPWHYLSCDVLKSTTVNRRHNDIKDILKKWCGRLGHVAFTEPRGLDNNSARRVDLYSSRGPHTDLLDIACVHPLAPSYINLAQEQLKIAEIEAADKRTHHAAAAALQRDNHRFRRRDDRRLLQGRPERPQGTCRPS